MERIQIEVADIFRLHGDRYRAKYPLSPEQSKVFNLIKVCRTSALGGHMQQCDHCDYEQPAYNSCRNRHCPKCQSTAKQKWLNARSRTAALRLLSSGLYAAPWDQLSDPGQQEVAPGRLVWQGQRCASAIR